MYVPYVMGKIFIITISFPLSAGVVCNLFIIIGKMWKCVFSTVHTVLYPYTQQKNIKFQQKAKRKRLFFEIQISSVIRWWYRLQQSCNMRCACKFRTFAMHGTMYVYYVRCHVICDVINTDFFIFLYLVFMIYVQ
jgi:hypothetical protein